MKYNRSVISPVQLERIGDDTRGEDSQRRTSVERDSQKCGLAHVSKDDPLSVGREGRIASVLGAGQKTEASFVGASHVERRLTAHFAGGGERRSVRGHDDIAPGVGHDLA